MLKSKALAGAVVVAAILSAAPAAAVITTFAQYQAIGVKGQTYFKNNGTTASNGSGGAIYTTSTPTSTTPGSRLVNFSFLQPSIAPFVTNVTASYTLFASVANAPAQLNGGFLVQPGLSGSFSFLTTSAIVIGGTSYAAGSNLLTGVFTQAAIFGPVNGTSGSLSASTSGGSSITYSSDFLSFDPTVERDFAISLTSITSPLARASSTKALRTFRAFSSGSFSSDPAPLVLAVPEPQVWGLMIVGFGLVGVQVRRRARQAIVAG